MAERTYYSYTIPLDKKGRLLIIHRSDDCIICHGIDKEGKGLILKIATDTFVTSGIDKMYGYKCGRAGVRKDGMLADDYGYIDYKGSIVIPIQYSKASDFEDGRAIVVKGNLLRNGCD